MKRCIIAGDTQIGKEMDWRADKRIEMNLIDSARLAPREDRKFPINAVTRHLNRIQWSLAKLAKITNSKH